MQQIFNFLIRNKNTLLFLFLLLLSITFTIQSHSFHKSKFISSTSFFTGSIYSFSKNINNYFNLKEYNKRLLKENTLLKEKLLTLTNIPDTKNTDSSNTKPNKPYHFKSALVINSTYHKLNNYITINKGIKDSIKSDMGVITDSGIVGIVEGTSKNYSRVISILNKNIKINAQLKKTNHFGSLTWNGKKTNEVQLIDIPRLAPLKVGDTIITGGRSTIFPKGILVGAIKSFHLNSNESYYTVNVKLFNDMTNIGFVNIIQNNNSQEIKSLETNKNE